jgi:hypothetical protein
MHRYIIIVPAYIYILVLIVVGSVYMWITTSIRQSPPISGMDKLVDKKPKIYTYTQL